MSKQIESLLPAIESLVAVGIEFCITASIWMILVCLAALLARHRSAAVQHAVWVAGMCGLLALPLTLVWLPKFRIVPLPQPSSLLVSAGPASLDVLTSEFPLVDQSSSREYVPDRTIVTASSVNPETTSRITTSVVLIFAWIAGYCLLALRMCLSLASLWRLAQQSDSANESLRREAEQCAMKLGLKRSYALIQHDRVATPMAFGIMSGRIALPSSIAIQSESERHAILLHELGHLRRYDPLWYGLVEAAFALLWFHPLVWFARRQSSLTRERACDDVVLSVGTEPAFYAHCLVSLVGGYQRAWSARSLSVAMSTSDRIEVRIRAIMDRKRDRRSLGFVRLGSVALSVAFVIVTLATLRLETRTAVAQETPTPRQAAPVESTDENPLRRIARGRITDESGLPILRTKMHFDGYSKTNGRQLRNIEVDNDGSFRIEHFVDAPVDDWIFACAWVYADGYAAKAVLFHVAFREANVSGIEIRLQKQQQPFALEVTLPNDQPCADALVTPASIHTCQVVAVDGQYVISETTGVFTEIPSELLQELGAVSDAQGKATVKSFVQTSFTGLHIRKLGFGQQGFGISNAKRVFKLAPTGAIAGRVAIDDPKAIAGTRVSIESNHFQGPRGIAEVIIDEKGEFNVPEIVACKQPLLIEMNWKEALPLHPYYDRDRRDAVPTGGVLDLVIETKPTVKVTGRILTGDTGEPVVGAKAVLNSLYSPFGFVRAKTDQQGYFTLRVCPGPTLQQVTSLGSNRLLEDRYDYPRMDQIKIPDDVTEIQLEPYLLTPKTIVKGILQDKTGKGIEGQTVVIHDKEYLHVAGRAVTDAMGSFTMPVRDWKFIAKEFGGNSRHQWSIAKGEQVVEATEDKNFVPLTVVQLENENVILQTE